MRQTPQDPARTRLEALWQDHAAAVVRYARRRVLPSEVDEVVAETFLIAWRRLDDIPGYPLPWLLGVARGVSANTRRGAARRQALTDRLSATLPRPEPNGLEGDGADALDGPLAAALAALRPQDRELLTLLAWDGLSQDQAARALGIGKAALAVRLHRLRRRMQARLPPERDSLTESRRDGQSHHDARWPSAPSIPLQELGDLS